MLSVTAIVITLLILRRKKQQRNMYFGEDIELLDGDLTGVEIGDLISSGNCYSSRRSVTKLTRQLWRSLQREMARCCSCFEEVERPKATASPQKGDFHLEV